MTSFFKKILKFFNLKLVKINDKSVNYLNLYPRKSIDNKCFYNVGAGSFRHPYWTNIDYYSDWYKKNKDDINSGLHYDLLSLKDMPIKSETAEVFYTSHVIEHITDKSVKFLFKEVYRCLKKGGGFRVTAPDVDLIYSAMTNNDVDFFEWRKFYTKKKDYERIKLNIPMNEASVHQLFIQRIAGSVSELHSDGAHERISDNELINIFEDNKYEDALNYICSKCPIEIQKKYPGNHINWFNKPKIINLLREAGFEDIYISGYLQSKMPILRDDALFDSTNIGESLYVEAYK